MCIWTGSLRNMNVLQCFVLLSNLNGSMMHYLAKLRCDTNRPSVGHRVSMWLARWVRQSAASKNVDTMCLSSTFNAMTLVYLKRYTTKLRVCIDFDSIPFLWSKPNGSLTALPEFWRNYQDVARDDHDVRGERMYVSPLFLHSDYRKEQYYHRGNTFLAKIFMTFGAGLLNH